MEAYLCKSETNYAPDGAWWVGSKLGRKARRHSVGKSVWAMPGRPNYENAEASKDYNAICGGSGIVKKNIAQTRNNPDMVATIPNPAGTILRVTGGTIGIGIIVLIIVCLL